MRTYLVQELRLHVEHALEVEGPQAQHIVELDLGLLRTEDGREGVDGLGCGRGLGRWGGGIEQSGGYGWMDGWMGERASELCKVKN
jgi:hypothetical protein